MTKRVPSGLSPDSRRIWIKVTRAYRLLPSDFELLILALRNWDMILESREILKRDGAFFKDKSGNLKLHPQAVVLKDSQNAFSKAWRALNFKEGPQQTGRPSQRKIHNEE